MSLGIWLYSVYILSELPEEIFKAKRKDLGQQFVKRGQLFPKCRLLSNIDAWSSPVNLARYFGRSSTETSLEAFRPLTSFQGPSRVNTVLLSHNYTQKYIMVYAFLISRHLVWGSHKNKFSVFERSFYHFKMIHFSPSTKEKSPAKFVL